jgi:hypothetical protein
MPPLSSCARTETVGRRPAARRQAAAGARHAAVGRAVKARCDGARAAIAEVGAGRCRGVAGGLARGLRVAWGKRRNACPGGGSIMGAGRPKKTDGVWAFQGLRKRATCRCAAPAGPCAFCCSPRPLRPCAPTCAPAVCGGPPRAAHAAPQCAARAAPVHGVRSPTHGRPAWGRRRNAHATSDPAPSVGADESAAFVFKNRFALCARNQVVGSEPMHHAPN